MCDAYIKLEINRIKPCIYGKNSVILRTVFEKKCSYNKKI